MTTTPERQFHKLHGAGNDFVLIDARGRPFQLTADRARKIADRRMGIGCDQILVVHDAIDPAHRARYEIYNADGSLAGQCGNGARCIGLYLDSIDPMEGDCPVESPSGVVHIRRCKDGQYQVGMGVPDFRPEAIALDWPQAADPYRVDSPWGELEFGSVSMGNPHALITVDDLENPAIADMGEWLGRQAIFAEGVNVGFAQLAGRDRIRLRVIERGVGETLACGSGACAAVAVLRARGLVNEVVEVNLPGGTLVIQWPGTAEPLLMKGPATYVFKGIMNV